MEKSSNNQMDKSLFFITLSAVCIWLIVDAAVGKKYLAKFLSTIFPFMSSGDSNTGKAEMSVEEVEEAKTEAPVSSAIGSNKESKPISGVPYGARR